MGQLPANSGRYAAEFCRAMSLVSQHGMSQFLLQADTHWPDTIET